MEKEQSSPAAFEFEAEVLGRLSPEGAMAYSPDPWLGACIQKKALNSEGVSAGSGIFRLCGFSLRTLGAFRGPASVGALWNRSVKVMPISGGGKDTEERLQ